MYLPLCEVFHLQVQPGLLIMASSLPNDVGIKDNQYYSKVSGLIENATRLKDLDNLIVELLPIDELKQLLLTKLNTKLEKINQTQ